jgi:hypothetical protein
VCGVGGCGVCMSQHGPLTPAAQVNSDPNTLLFHTTP